MANPLNPLEWLRSTQDWFSKSEKSSGFRPFLIYLLIVFSIGVLLIFISKDRLIIETLGVFLIALPAASFIPLYAWKSHTDPDFCRSENHVQKIRKYELEIMGSEAKQVSGEVIDNNALNAIPEPSQIVNAESEVRQ